MEEIHIYRSPWRLLFFVFLGILMTGLGVFILHVQKNMFQWIIGWVDILFFGFCTFWVALSLLKERLMNQPFLTITDESLVCRSPQTLVVNFADVESFSIEKVNDSSFIAIHYKPNVERQKMEDASIFGRLCRSMNSRLINAQDSITVTGMNMKGEQLCDLLNERLKRA